MARLLTHHDPYHVHKTLGLASLLHFLFRCVCFCRLGTAFPSTEPVWLASLGVLMHGVLSWSSLLLPLPTKRNYSSPMIWPEFRLHSITFATRHVFCTLMNLNHAWPSNVYVFALSKLAVIVGISKCADLITAKCGDKESRTTNAMPYPSTVSPEIQRAIKMEYARAQFGATVGACMPDPTIAFIPLLPIQIAPLLMTLVRKGKIGATAYHAIYSFSLWIVWVAVVIIICNHQVEHTMDLMFASAVSPMPLRLRYGLNKTMLWTVYSLLVYLLYPLFLRSHLSRFEEYAHWGVFFVLVVAYEQFLVYEKLWRSWLGPVGSDEASKGNRAYGWGTFLLRLKTSRSANRALHC